MCLLYDTDDQETALANNLAHHREYPQTLFAATIPTLQYLKAIGMMTGVVTATIRESILHDHVELGIPPELIDYIQAADDSTYHKPDPRVFEPAIHWLGQQGITPNEVLYVGDGLHDMHAALGAGFAFLGVETGLVSADEFSGAGAASIPDIGYLMQECP